MCWHWTLCLSHIGERQTFLAQMGPHFILGYSLCLLPSLWWRQRCWQHWKNSHSRNSVITWRRSREDTVGRYAGSMFILENVKLHLTRSECELTFTFSSTVWVRLAFVIIIHETSKKPGGESWEAGIHGGRYTRWGTMSDDTSSIK